MAAADQCTFQDSMSYILAGLLAISIMSNLFMKKNFVQNCKDLCAGSTSTQASGEEMKDKEIAHGEESHPIIGQEVAMKEDDDQGALLATDRSNYNLTTTMNDTVDDEAQLLCNSETSDKGIEMQTLATQDPDP